MEYTPGIKINRVADLDREGVNRQLLAKRTVESYLQQLLTYGFFHAGEPCYTALIMLALIVPTDGTFCRFHVGFCPLNLRAVQFQLLCLVA